VQLERIASLARETCKKYFDDTTSLELINYEFNATFKVQSGGQAFALRLNINSTRTRENAFAEVALVRFLGQHTEIRVPQVRLTLNGEAVTLVKIDGIEHPIPAVMYSWLEGNEVGDEPSESQLTALGAAMAKMHDAAVDFAPPTGSDLPTFDDFFWGTEDFLFSPLSQLSPEVSDQLQTARYAIDDIVLELYQRDGKRVIHADLHGWNLMWQNNILGIFDFDDCGFGLPVQDLATALYYLDTPEQDAALIKGYRSIRDLPEYSEREMKALLLHRRILLLNYLYETSNKEHQALLPEYLPETLRRVEEFLENKF